jgi:cell division protein FtsI/penicillin-binding protein 2/cell division protein FtsW (lipid II flippase)
VILGELAPLWGGFMALHAALTLRRVETDEYLLPLLSLITLVGGVFHLGLDGAGGGAIRTYRSDVLIGVAVIGAVVLLATPLRRLGLLFEERVWWRYARDVPYYSSVPFHLALLVLMAVLTLWLVVRGRPEAGALVRVPLPGGMSFTPSEFVRLAVAFFLAQYLAANARVLRNLRQPLGRIFPLNRFFVEHRPELVTLLTMLGLYGVFFFVLRDFGPAAIIFGLTLVCLYAATNLGVTPVLLLGLAVAFASYMASHGVSTFGNRLNMWLDPWDTSFPNGDHLARMLWGVASGGPFGVGAGTVRLRTLLPVASRDAAFSGIATTLGLWTGLALLLLFAALTWRGFAIARARRDDEGRLLAFSLTTLLALQAVWICAAGVGIMPLSGINLPFVSTGLSSMLASCIALGVLLNLSRPVSGEWSVVSGEGGTTGSPLTTVPEAPIRRLGLALTAAFALPAGGLIAYGTPFLLGDRTLTRTAAAIGRRGERTTFSNPYLDRFRRQFARGMIFSHDRKLLATDGAGQQADGSPARRYPLGSAGAQLVGWTTGGRFATLPDSVEAAYESPLRGYREEDLPRLFRQRHNPLTRRRWPQPHNVYLTISGRLQQYAAERLRFAVRRAGGTGGAAVLMDAATGQVLAAVSEPSFDPTGMSIERMRQLIRQDRSRGLLRNKPLSQEAIFFPGSTFKLVTAAAALRRPVSGEAHCAGINTREISWEHDGRRYRRRTGVIHDFGRGGHGYLGLEARLDTALAQSCNVFFATLAARLGAETLREEMVRCEFAHVPSERVLADYLPEAGFGQVAVKVAPIELARIAAAVGVARTEESQGSVPRPFWVQKVVDAGGHAVRMEGLPGAPRDNNFQPFEPAVAQRLRTMMLEVVNAPAGTAHRAFYRDGAPRLPGITVGGKTGTAELDVEVTLKSGKRAKVRRQHAWFVGFAQKEDEVPVRTLAFVVLVEQVRGRQTGGAICAPVARDLVAQLLRPSASAALVPREPWVDKLVDQGRRAVQDWLTGPRSPLIPPAWRKRDQ